MLRQITWASHKPAPFLQHCALRSKRRCYVSTSVPNGHTRKSSVIASRFNRRQGNDTRLRHSIKVQSQRVQDASVAPLNTEFDLLKGLSVVRAKNGDSVPLVSVFQNYGPDHICLLPFLTHFADLSSWEYAKKLKSVLPQLEAAGVQVIVVGLGDRQNAMLFSKLLDFPLRLLYADPEGVCYKALGFHPGFASDASLSPYLKLLVMLAGIGSPGTIQEQLQQLSSSSDQIVTLLKWTSSLSVLRGYTGDRSSQPVWAGNSLFNVLGKDYQRPFELATLRLNNMVNILPRWNKLGPEKTTLLTQQGGTLLFSGERTVLRQDDTGILKYAELAAFATEVQKLKGCSITTASQV